MPEMIYHHFRQSLPLGRTAFGHVIAVVLLIGCVHVPTTAVAQDDDIPQWLGEQLGIGVTHRRDNGEMTSLVQPIANAVAKSVVQVVCGGRPVALGTIVSSDGYVITKRSELTGDPILIRLSDDRQLSARVAAVRRSCDLALLHVDSGQNYQPIEWSSDVPPVGSFLISPGRGAKTIGIGVVSVLARPVEHQGRLGVYLEDDTNGFARIGRVHPDSGAALAGLERNDRIVAIDGQSKLDASSCQKTLGGKYAGESVRLTIDRSGSILEVDAMIREFNLMQESENDSKVNGPRNIRLSGFELAIQHDTVLDPDECGGPVLDSKGKVIGVNIARAGRVVSYALPASLVIPEMQSMLEEARAAAR